MGTPCALKTASRRLACNDLVDGANKVCVLVLVRACGSAAALTGQTCYVRVTCQCQVQMSHSWLHRNVAFLALVFTRDAATAWPWNSPRPISRRPLRRVSPARGKPASPDSEMDGWGGSPGVKGSCLPWRGSPSSERVTCKKLSTHGCAKRASMRTIQALWPGRPAIAAGRQPCPGRCTRLILHRASDSPSRKVEMSQIAAPLVRRPGHGDICVNESP